MPIKRSASLWESTASDDNSSGGNNRFVISPHPRRVTRKQTHGGEGSSSHADEEAAGIAKGHTMIAARGARTSDVIQKVEHPLKTDFEYTLRRVDRRNPRRATDFTRGENQSMINWNEDPYE
jgi:hypothetical protein